MCVVCVDTLTPFCASPSMVKLPLKYWLCFMASSPLH